MKRILCMILALFTVICFAACGSTTTPATDNGGSQNGNTPVAATDGYVFTYNGTKIAMHAEAAPIIAALGEPKSYTEEASCAFTGLDKTYNYGGFFLNTYPIGDQDYIYGVCLMDDSSTTPEGIYIGASQAEVEAAYGTEGFNGSNAYILKGTTSTLTIILEDGAVSSIQYDAIIE